MNGNGRRTALVLVVAGLVSGCVVSVLVLSIAATAQTATADSDSDLACVDQNDNGVIDRAEVIRVINEYLFGPEPSPPPSLDGTTRSKAFPYGQRFRAGNFDMQIVALDTDAWPEVQEEYSNNDPPAEGDSYVMWTIEVENVRGSVDEYEEIDKYGFEVVGSKNAVTYSPFSDGCGIIPDQLGNILGTKLYKGGETRGNLCFSVETDETGLAFVYDDDHDDSAGESFDVRVWFEGLPD